jgi:hypothetical protein
LQAELDKVDAELSALKTVKRKDLAQLRPRAE